MPVLALPFVAHSVATRKGEIALHSRMVYRGSPVSAQFRQGLTDGIHAGRLLPQSNESGGQATHLGFVAIGVGALRSSMSARGVMEITKYSLSLSSPSGTRSKSLSLWTRNSARSEEHTSELQSPCNLVCRLLL